MVTAILAPTAPAVKPHTRAAEIPAGHPWQDWTDDDFEQFEDYLRTIHADDRDAVCERASDAYASHAGPEDNPADDREPTEDEWDDYERDRDDATDPFPPEHGGESGVDATDSYATDDRRSGLCFADEPGE